MRYCAVTFNPHINETHLIDEFLILFHPLMKKQSSFCITKEKQDTPGVHLHAIFPMPDSSSNSHILQKFSSPGWDKFKKQLIQTEWDPKLQIYSFKAILVEIDKNDNPHNYLYWLGYINKEKSVIIASKGYSQDFLTSAVKYYYLNTRKNDTTKDKNVIYDLNAKNLKGYMRSFCEKHGILLNDKMLPVRLAEKGIALDNVSTKQLVRAIAFLNIYRNELEPGYLTQFEINYYHSNLTDDVTTDKANQEFSYKLIENQRATISEYLLKIEMDKKVMKIQTLQIEKLTLQLAKQAKK